MRVIEWHTKKCGVYRIWFKDKTVIKFEPGEYGTNLEHSTSLLNDFLDGVTQLWFKELTPVEIEKLKIETL